MIRILANYQQQGVDPEIENMSTEDARKLLTDPDRVNEVFADRTKGGDLHGHSIVAKAFSLVENDEVFMKQMIMRYVAYMQGAVVKNSGLDNSSSVFGMAINCSKFPDENFWERVFDITRDIRVLDKINRYHYLRQVYESHNKESENEGEKRLMNGIRRKIAILTNNLRALEETNLQNLKPSVGNRNFPYMVNDAAVFYSCDTDSELGEPKAIENSDAPTFRVLTYHWAKDKNQVYFQKDGKLEVKSWADPQTFQIFDSGWTSGGWIVSGESVYFFGYDEENVQKIESADSKTFVKLRGKWAKDRNKVYIFNGSYVQVLGDADPDTFEVLESGEGKDKNHEYNWLGEVENSGSEKKDGHTEES